jgi:hypothetical protein
VDSPPLRRFSPILLSVALGLLATGAAAGGKSHLGAPPDQMINLIVLAPNDNTQNELLYDTSGPVFTVPDRMVFVMTDVRVTPESPTSLATDNYLVLVGVTGRTHFARFFGAGYDESLTAGLVFPAGSTLAAINTSASAGSVIVSVQGYLTKGTALAPGAPF